MDISAVEQNAKAVRVGIVIDVLKEWQPGDCRAWEKTVVRAKVRHVRGGVCATMINPVRAL